MKSNHALEYSIDHTFCIISGSTLKMNVKCDFQLALKHNRYETLLQKPKGFANKNVRLSMTPTLRANDSVCVKSATDGYLYFNLTAFSQQNFYDETTDHLNDGRRPWIYYVMRCDRLCDNGKGLYNVGIRNRLKFFLSRHLREGVGSSDNNNDGEDGEEYSRGWVDLGSL